MDARRSHEHPLTSGVSELLGALDTAGENDEWLEAFLSDAERAVNVLRAAQADAMVQLERNARAADASLPADLAYLAGRREEGVVDQIAIALTCTRVAAAHRYEAARMADQMPHVRAAWRRGDIDEGKVSVIGDALATCQVLDTSGTVDGLETSRLRDQLSGDAVEHAVAHTAPQTRAWLARRVIAQDPAAARRRHERASGRRRVTLHSLADGMAELVALLPAVQARRAFDTLGAAAHSLDGKDDARSMDQRRADAMVDLLCGRATPPTVKVNVTVDLETLRGTADRPVELGGYGPVDSATLRWLLRDAELEFRRLLIDDGTAVAVDPTRYRPTPDLAALIRARDLTCRFPGCRRTVTATRSGVDLDHTVPWPAGSTIAQNLSSLCRHHHRVKHAPGWSVRQEPDGVMVWTTPGGRQVVTRPWCYVDQDQPAVQRAEGHSAPPDPGPD